MVEARLYVENMKAYGGMIMCVVECMWCGMDGKLLVVWECVVEGVNVERTHGVWWRP